MFTSLMIIPPKLNSGDKIRVIAPSASMYIPQPWNTEELRKNATKTLENLGFELSFGKHVMECDGFNSTSIDARLEDLHEAFADKNINMVLSAIGGFNANQLLRYIDYDLIKSNPKIFCGYSDITVLGNAIYAKTGLVNYSGPHFTTFGGEPVLEYTLDYFKKCLSESKPFRIESSEKWCDFSKQFANDGYWIINEGEASGTILGGNLCTLNEIQGTEFFPDLQNSILFLEDDSLVSARIFDRDLQSLIHQPGFELVKGIVIGRFQPESEVSQHLLSEIIKTKRELARIPVIANADFGHTIPRITFPIGGTVNISAQNKSVLIEILEH